MYMQQDLAWKAPLEWCYESVYIMMWTQRIHSYAVSWNALEVLWLTDALLSTDKSNLAAAPETVGPPEEVLTSVPIPSDVLQSTEGQVESAAVASHQETSVAIVVDRLTLPPSLTESQGQSDVDQIFNPLFQSIFLLQYSACLVYVLSDPADVESLVLDDAPKQASHPPAAVQQAWEQEVQQLLWLFIFINYINHNISTNLFDTFECI